MLLLGGVYRPLEMPPLATWADAFGGAREMSEHQHGHAEHGHEHSPDGGCCDHDHGHDRGHDHGHKESGGCCDHGHEESGGEHGHGHGHDHGHEEKNLTGDDICGDGGVLKTILVEGDATQGTPPPGSKVTVHYVGKLLDGSKFDSSRDRPGHFEFTIGQGQVIKGWDSGVATMHKGEKATLICRSDYAYGERGSPPKIPGGATLNFEVELFSWKEARKEKWQLTDEQKLEEATAYKAKGTAAFQAGHFAEAQGWCRATCKTSRRGPDRPASRSLAANGPRQAEAGGRPELGLALVG
jgi:hypothetical protein